MTGVAMQVRRGWQPQQQCMQGSDALSIDMVRNEREAVQLVIRVEGYQPKDLLASASGVLTLCWRCAGGMLVAYSLCAGDVLAAY